jgi:hypothetical protein
VRTLVEIPDDDIRWLDEAAAERGLSRTALVREAVTQLREGVSRKGIDPFCGMWRDRADIGDAQVLLRRIRGGHPD